MLLPPHRNPATAAALQFSLGEQRIVEVAMLAGSTTCDHYQIYFGLAQQMGGNRVSLPTCWKVLCSPQTLPFEVYDKF